MKSEWISSGGLRVFIAKALCIYPVVTQVLSI